MPADTKQLFILKCLLQTVAVSTGLKVNFHKSFIVPINVDAKKTNILEDTLGCLVRSMPFTYLGLPLGTTKPMVQDFMPVLSRIEKKKINEHFPLDIIFRAVDIGKCSVVLLTNILHVYPAAPIRSGHSDK
jgi:hypothetical protein